MQIGAVKVQNYPIKMLVSALLVLTAGIALLVAVNGVIQDIIENNMRLLLIKSETEEFVKAESVYLQEHNPRERPDSQLARLNAITLNPLIHAALFGGETPLGSLRAVNDPHMRSDLQSLEALLVDLGQSVGNAAPAAMTTDELKKILAQVSQLAEDMAGDVRRLIEASRYQLIFLQLALFLIMLTLYFVLVQAYRHLGMTLKEQDRQIREEMARRAALETQLERNQNQLQGLEKANSRLVLINASVSQFRDAGELNALAKRNEDLLRRLVTDAMALTKARSGALSIFDKAGTIQTLIAEGGPRDLEALIGGNAQASVAATFKDKAVLRIKSAARDTPGYPANLLGVPLMVAGTCRGAFYLADKVDGEEFVDDDEAVLHLYAFDLVSAIERADFILELQDRNEQLQRKQDEQEKLIHQLKTAQMQLLQSEKMASIGQLAAGVAHEINNPIGYVGSNLVSLQQYVDDICGLLGEYEKVEQCLPADSRSLADLQGRKRAMDLEFVRQDLRDLLKECNEGVHRVRKIVNDLRDFSHISEGEWQWVDVHKGLDSTLNIARNEIKYKAAVVKEYGELPMVECMSQQLNQVFMNLLVNAAQAVEQQGIITLRSGVEGEGVCIEIADNGRGILPEHMPHLFEPFFTTKPAGKGTGLGLAISYSIIKEHGGHITVNSEPGKGAAFRVWLPARQARSGAEPGRTADAPLALAKEG